MDKATFAMGCFWGPEVTFGDLDGVLETSVGYMGGELDNPTYRDVCSGTTGHAEVVQVVFDAAIITYEQLLHVFWTSHDPAQLNRQGPDFGSQYRSAIFCHSRPQQDAAEKSRTVFEQSNHLHGPVVTVIQQAEPYWIGEDYHQKYIAKRNGLT
jgi:peptide-methionine (S)-S-oxide reductase